MNLMNFLIWGFFISLFIALCLFIIIFLSRTQVWQALKLRFLKRRGYGLVIELTNSKTTRTFVQKITPEIILPKNKTYIIDKLDVHFNLDYMAPQVIVNENLGRSIGHELTDMASKISPEVLTSSIMRAKWLGAGEFSIMLKKLLTFILIGLGIAIIVGIATAYFIYSNNGKLKALEASIELIKAKLNETSTAVLL